MASIAVMGTGVTLAPLIPEDRARRNWSFATTMGDAWLAKGEPRRALTSFEQAIAIDRGSAMQGANTSAARTARASMYEDAGTTHALLGDDQRALECFAIAVQLAPDAASARVRFAEQLALCGRFDDARAQYAAAGLPLQEAANPLVERAARGHWPADSAVTRKLLSAAAGILPGFEPATVPLVRLEIMAGSLEAASAILRTAEANGIDQNVARAHAAWIRAARGDTVGARRILKTIPPGIRAGDQRVAGTLELLRRQTGWKPL